MILIELAKKDAQWRKMALQICKDKDLADELVQEMYIKVSTKTKPLSDGYIFVTLRSLFYDHLKNKDILVDDFSQFQLIVEEYSEELDIDYIKLTKNLTWYERTMFELSTLVGQRELERQTGIPLQTIHRINKMVKLKLNGKKKN
jgi:DNA-directed RNA polymerase specialized sigma24 family protein